VESSIATAQHSDVSSISGSAPLKIAAVLAGLGFAILMITAGRYGYFRDELYFIACSDHLAFGYVDFAPLSAFLLHLARSVFGSSLHAIRLIPALAFAADIFITGLIVRELGGKKWATLLACGSVLVAPIIIANAQRFSMNPMEPVFWIGCVYFLIAADRRQKPQLLIWCGVCLGLGMLNKHSAVFFIAALMIGLLCTRDRQIFRSKYFWIAVALAAAIALPNFIWQVQHDFPTWVDLRNVQKTHKNVELPPIPFIMQQIMSFTPVAAIVWVPGLIWLLVGRAGSRGRSLGIAFVVFFTLMMLLHAKDYYVSPIYPMLFAAGAAWWEQITSARFRWLRVAVPVVVFAVGVISLPIVLPVLPVEKIVPYREALGLKMSQSEVAHSGPLPQFFGDQFGWPEMVETVAGVYHSLPPEQREKTAILAGNYGEAGAIDFFGSRYGLPKSISAHQNYYFWGPRQYTGESLILLQWSLAGAQRWCSSVEQGPTLNPQWAMAEEHYTILICRGFKVPLAAAWPRLKHWN
jgi:Dolichyl-phosphate-mannose-protein mannosyltransferase